MTRAKKTRRRPGMAGKSGAHRRSSRSGADSLLSISQGADGVWTVREQGLNKAALSYFASKWSAIRHAVRAARTKPNCRVQVLDSAGGIESSRSYEEEPGRAVPRAG